LAESTEEERRVRRRHPIRNYLLFATLAIAGIVALSLKIEPAAGARSEGFASDSVSVACEARGASVALPEIPEASGVALSRRTPGLLWTHTDQGAPTLYAIDASGVIKGRVKVTGPASLEDWEDIAAGPCGSESCLYLGDIGDNNARRKHISVYRVREPTPGDAATQRADVFQASYPDGPQDAEALVVSKEGRILVVTKGVGKPITVYRFPEPLHVGVSVQLEKVGTLAPGKTPKDERVTGASVSPDGARIALRTHDAVLLYDAREFLRGQLDKPQRFDVSSLQEPQGEGVALGTGGDVFLVSEGGGKQRPGSLAHAVCRVGN
jgi:hypothetical protein